MSGTMRSIFLGLILSALIATPALADMSGTYVGEGRDLAVMVQIVETRRGHFTGRYELVVLQADGKTKDTNAIIAGVRDGETVVGTIKVPGLLAPTIPVSGSYRGGLLHLTGGMHLVLNLIRGNEAKFGFQVAKLTARGRKIVEIQREQQAAGKEAKLEADRLSRLQNLTGRLVSFDAEADEMLTKFAPTERRWRWITGQMRGGLIRQRSIFGGGQEAVARSQIAYSDQKGHRLFSQTGHPF